MKWNFDNDQRFKKGERYHLVVDHAEDKESNSGTPFLKIHFKLADTGEKAFDKALWKTEKAAYRAKEWARAMGFGDEGEVDLDPDKMAGIHLTAEADYQKNNDDGKSYLEWVKPEPISGAEQAKPQPSAAAAAPAPEQEQAHVEEVPF